MSSGRFYFSKTHWALAGSRKSGWGREGPVSIYFLAPCGPAVLWNQSCERHLWFCFHSCLAALSLGKPLNTRWALGHDQSSFPRSLCGCGWPLERQKTRWPLYSISVTKHQLCWAIAWHGQHVHITKNNKQYLCVYWWEEMMYGRQPA